MNFLAVAVFGFMATGIAFLAATIPGPIIQASHAGCS